MFRTPARGSPHRPLGQPGHPCWVFPMAHGPLEACASPVESLTLAADPTPARFSPRIAPRFDRARSCRSAARFTRLSPSSSLDARWVSPSRRLPPPRRSEDRFRTGWLSRLARHDTVASRGTGFSASPAGRLSSTSRFFRGSGPGPARPPCGGRRRRDAPWARAAAWSGPLAPCPARRRCRPAVCQSCHEVSQARTRSGSRSAPSALSDFLRVHPREPPALGAGPASVQPSEDVVWRPFRPLGGWDARLTRDPWEPGRPKTDRGHMPSLVRNLALRGG